MLCHKFYSRLCNINKDFLNFHLLDELGGSDLGEDRGELIDDFRFLLIIRSFWGVDPIFNALKALMLLWPFNK